MGQPVVHFEIIGNDAAALQAFYSELFGWKPQRFETNSPMNYGLVPREENVLPDGTGIAGGIGEAPEGESGWVTFYVEVPDVEAALADAERLGGTRVSGPDSVTEGLVIGQFRDPDGHLIGIATNTAP
ncbi:MAG TPA: VOC family protein [Acidimicrobiales bacterium]|jgi:predicted enzyme related to lactoylglutathione lyase|nr:VOC family protein [Acidimicrobiales bacterium]